MYPSSYPPAFTSAHVRATVLRVLLIVAAVVASISLVVDALVLVFPPLTEDQELGENPSGAALVFAMVLIAVLELIIYFTTVVFFVMWLYRSYKNLRALGPQRLLTYSPAMAAGSFFIPFANLIVPYRAVRETWQKSGPPDEALLSEPSPPVWFPMWWAFWLLASIVGNISMRVSLNEDVPESTSAMVAIIAGVLYIVAAILAYSVVTAIDERQEKTSRSAGLGKFSGPPPPPGNLSTSNVLAPSS
jgi:uncharacterized protein DUF4328